MYVCMSACLFDFIWFSPLSVSRGSDRYLPVKTGTRRNVEEGRGREREMVRGESRRKVQRKGGKEGRKGRETRNREIRKKGRGSASITM
jgi:hypothetical protein